MLTITVAHVQYSYALNIFLCISHQVFKNALLTRYKL